MIVKDRVIHDMFVLTPVKFYVNLLVVEALSICSIVSR